MAIKINLHRTSTSIINPQSCLKLFEGHDPPPHYFHNSGPGKYYRRYSGNERENYDDAVAKCAEDNAILAIFKTDDEFNYVKGQRDICGDHDMFIGVTNPDRRECDDNECHNKLYWTDGTKFQWHNRYPEVKSDDDQVCFYLKNDYKVEGKKQSDCNSKRCFLCEYDPNFGKSGKTVITIH